MSPNRLVKRLRSFRSGSRRKGATAIECALVMPAFLVFLFLLIEYGHYLWVDNMLTAAVRNGARFGSTEGATNADVDNYIRSFMLGTAESEAIDIQFKDGSVFESDEDNPVVAADYDELDNVELGNVESRQLFIVRANINFGDVAFLRFPGVDRVDMTGQSIMRHE